MIDKKYAQILGILGFFDACLTKFTSYKYLFIKLAAAF